MALLTQMYRTAAITGDTDRINAWLATRQGGRWAEQKVRSAFPATRSASSRPQAAAGPLDPAETLRKLTALHGAGVITDAEFERLRAGIAAPDALGHGASSRDAGRSQAPR